MSRIRMFGDDEPENPSPRTTIVGGQPPQRPVDLPPVPTGIQRLLRLAAVDADFRRELLTRRGAIGPAAEVELTASEVAILHAIPAAQLEAMILKVPPPEEDRRSFLRQTAATAVMLLGGAALSGCSKDMRTVGGAAPDVPPPRPDVPAEPPPARPAHRDMETDGGINPALRRQLEAERRRSAAADAGAPQRVPDDTRPMAGVTAPETPQRVDHRLQAPGGAAPDLPPPPRPPDGGTAGPKR